MQVTKSTNRCRASRPTPGCRACSYGLQGAICGCSWCDSEYTFHGGRKISAEEVLDAVKRLSPNGGLVEITGGEPMLQERELLPLMEKLLQHEYRVLIETSGERPLARVPAAVIKIVDVKCPHSGAPHTFLHEKSGGAHRPRRSKVRNQRPHRLRIPPASSCANTIWPSA